VSPTLFVSVANIAAVTHPEIEKELEQAYERFIAFGQLLDQRMRTYIVQYLQNKFDPDRHLVPDLNERYFNYLQKALDRIFLIDGLTGHDPCKNPKLKKQLILDTLYWLRKVYKQDEDQKSVRRRTATTGKLGCHSAQGLP
jgi:hypothetical protein